jgi:hypothetical protein
MMEIVSKIIAMTGFDRKTCAWYNKDVQRTHSE